jgi:lactoylglutathione lyase
MLKKTKKYIFHYPSAFHADDFYQKEDAMFLGLRTVIYHVDNLKKAKKWYTKALEVTPYFDESFYVGFKIGGFELGLHPGMQGIHKGNNVAVYWGVKDIKSAYAHLLDMGATENEPIQEVGGYIKVATVIDPFGRLIGIIENPHFKSNQT